MFSRIRSDTSKPAPKALAMVSGGLDSCLAVHLVQRQGIEVTGLHSTSFFSPLDPNAEDCPVTVTARQLGIQVLFRPKGPDFMDVIRRPKYGHGKNINPCVDCRIYTFKKAKEIMAEVGASFIVTGEVVGQRPMSQQRHSMRLIEKQSGCDGLVLRPLSAKLLRPTMPELEGLVNREELLDVAGRGRKVQFRLAEEMGLTGYSTPAGGCLLTDVSFSRRLRDLLDEADDPKCEELDLLRFGRHFRIRPGLKIVVGRGEAENDRIVELAAAGVLFFPEEFPGPTVIAQGAPEPSEELFIGSVIRRYSGASKRGESIVVQSAGSDDRTIIVTDVAVDDHIRELMI